MSGVGLFEEIPHFENPPVLHRKETFVPSDYPHRKKFEKLTKQEEKHGLFENTKIIGTKNGWDDFLKMKGVRLRGHRVASLGS